MPQHADSLPLHHLKTPLMSYDYFSGAKELMIFVKQKNQAQNSMLSVFHSHLYKK